MLHFFYNTIYLDIKFIDYIIIIHHSPGNKYLYICRQNNSHQYNSPFTLPLEVFTNEIGGIINPDTISSWFKGFIKRYNLSDAHIHTLRHISATLLIAGGVDIATVSKRLGHANKSTTLNIYTHAIKSADEAASEMLENILNPSAHYKIG